MKKLVGLAVTIVVIYFLGTTLLEEFAGSPAPEGRDE